MLSNMRRRAKRTHRCPKPAIELKDSKLVQVCVVTWHGECGIRHYLIFPRRLDAFPVPFRDVREFVAEFNQICTYSSRHSSFSVK